MEIVMRRNCDQPRGLDFLVRSVDAYAASNLGGAQHEDRGEADPGTSCLQFAVCKDSSALLFLHSSQTFRLQQSSTGAEP